MLRIDSSQENKFSERKSIKDRFKLKKKSKRKKLEYLRNTKRELWNRKYLMLLTVRSGIEITTSNHWQHKWNDASERNLCACLLRQKKMNILTMSYFYEPSSGYTAMKIMDQMVVLQGKSKQVDLMRRSTYMPKEITFLQYLARK